MKLFYYFSYYIYDTNTTNDDGESKRNKDKRSL